MAGSAKQSAFVVQQKGLDYFVALLTCAKRFAFVAGNDDST
jgi:hypothetical protein